MPLDDGQDILSGKIKSKKIVFKGASKLDGVSKIDCKERWGGELTPSFIPKFSVFFIKNLALMY